MLTNTFLVSYFLLALGVALFYRLMQASALLETTAVSANPRRIHLSYAVSAMYSFAGHISIWDARHIRISTRLPCARAATATDTVEVPTLGVLKERTALELKTRRKLLVETKK